MTDGTGPRRRHSILVACLAVMALTPAIPVHGAPRDDTVAILQNIEQSDAMALEAWVEGATGGQVRVGDPIGFRFRSGTDVYLTTVYVDASGAVTVLHGGNKAHRMQAGRVVSFPQPGSKKMLIVSPPLGIETVFAIATLEPLPEDMFGEGDDIPVATIERPEDGRHLAQRIADYVSIMPEGTVDVASVSHEIVPASSPQRYSSTSIVEHFSTQTRSLTRRKLDLDIQFKFGSDELTDASRDDLDELGRALEHPAMKNRRFELAGHTDDVGSASYNMGLSKRRANSARGYLLERFEIDPETVRSAGYGEDSPLLEGTTDEARRRNRRVVIEQLP
jgi:outer membrane protein OmpA-like peptidoglycan-associated protein